MKKLSVLLLGLLLAAPAFGQLGPDFDGDGMPDAQELAEGRNPLLRDNAVFQNQRWFVQQAVRDLFLREPSAEEVDAWLTNPTVPQPGGPAEIMWAMLHSDDFATKVYPAYALHRIAYAGVGRLYPGDQLTPAQETTINNLLHPSYARLVQGIENYLVCRTHVVTAWDLVRSDMFLQLYPESLSAAEFMNLFAQDHPDAFTAEEINQWAQRLSAGQVQRADVLVATQAKNSYFPFPSLAHELVATLLRQRGVLEGITETTLINNTLAQEDATGFLTRLFWFDTSAKGIESGVKTTTNYWLKDPEYISRLQVAPQDQDGDQAPDAVEQYDVNTNPLLKDNDVFADARLFARQLARDFANREATPMMAQRLDAQHDSAGLPLPVGSARSQEQIVVDTLHLPAIQAKAGAIWRLYQAGFGTSPKANALLYWQNRLRSNSPLSALAEAMVLRPEFKARFPQTDASAFVQAFYLANLNRAPTSTELNQWVSALNQGQSRAVLLQTLALSAQWYKPARQAAQSWDLLHLLLQRQDLPALDATAQQQLALLTQAYSQNSTAQALALEQQLARAHLNSSSYHHRFLP